MTATASDQSPLAARKSVGRPAPLILMVSVVLVLSGCAATADIAGPTSAAASMATPTPPSLTATPPLATKSSASSSASHALATTAATTSKTQVLAALCDRNCPELLAVYHLPNCTAAAGDCLSQVDRAKGAIKALRQDMVDHNIDRADYIDLDDAITSATSSLDSPDLLPCGLGNAGSDDAIFCPIVTKTATTTVGTVAILLGGKT